MTLMDGLGRKFTGTRESEDNALGFVLNVVRHWSLMQNFLLHVVCI